MAQTATQQNTPVPLRKGTVHRFPATERGRKARHTRLARQRYLVPPTDGSVSEWRSWHAEGLHCEMCRQDSCPRVHLLLNLYGGFTVWRPCEHCRHLHEAPTVARQLVIAIGERLGGWAPVTGAHSLLEARKQHTALLADFQRRRAAGRVGGHSGGGDRGA